MARIGRLRERRLLRRAAEDALAGGTLEQLLGAPTDSSQLRDAGPTPRATAYPRAVAPAGLADNAREPGTTQNTNTPPRADDMFGGLLVAPWMFSMRARPWYRTRPAAILFVGAAAAVVTSGVLLALHAPTTSTEKPPTVATTPSTRAAPSTHAAPPASSEPTTSSIPPSPPIAPPPSPAWADQVDPEPAVGGPGSLQEPPAAEPIDPGPAIADEAPPEEPPAAEPTEPEPDR